MSAGISSPTQETAQIGQARGRKVISGFALRHADNADNGQQCNQSEEAVVVGRIETRGIGQELLGGVEAFNAHHARALDEGEGGDPDGDAEDECG